ncbi:MAG: LD-carboxypeptidase [Thermoanaerobaculia bacterium]
MLRAPRALPSEPHIAVLAASSPSDLVRIEGAVGRLELRGIRVTVADNVGSRGALGYLAGDDPERLAELNRFLRSDDYDAYLFARGGYGAMRILDGIDYDAIARNPRPLVGFSDVTALHQAIAVRAGVASFHGPMLNLDFYDGLSPEHDAWFWSMLRGESPLSYPFSAEQILAEGEAEGVLFGGCLSLTTSLIGTPYDFWIDDGIWFFEDVDEPVYRVDRMLTHLRLSGRLSSLRGVLIGKLKGCGGEAEMLALLQQFFGSNHIPVIRDLPFGHHGNNLLMPIGAPVHISTSSRSLTITQPAVQR